MPPWCLIKLKNLDWIPSPQSSKAQDTPGEELHYLVHQRGKDTRSASVIGLNIKIHWFTQNFLSNCYGLVSGTNAIEIHKGNPTTELEHNNLPSRSEIFTNVLFNLEEVIKPLTLGLNVFLVKWGQRYLAPKTFWLR